MKFLILAADFYPDITASLINGATKALEQSAQLTDPPALELKRVKGALELPLALSIHRKGSYDGAMALGCIIKGETLHFDLVANHSFSGLMEVATRHQLPLGYGIITALNRSQALERAKPPPQRNAGWDAAEALVALVTQKPEPLVSHTK